MTDGLGRRAAWAVVTILGVVVGAYSTLLRATISGEPIAQAASNTASATWRVEGWVILLTQWAKSPANWFIGEPFGASFRRLIEGSEVVAGPHNFYIEVLLRTGACRSFGAACFDGRAAGRDLAQLHRGRRSIWVRCARGFARDAADLVYDMGARE